MSFTEGMSFANYVKSFMTILNPIRDTKTWLLGFIMIKKAKNYVQMAQKENTINQYYSKIVVCYHLGPFHANQGPFQDLKCFPQDEDLLQRGLCMLC